VPVASNEAEQVNGPVPPLTEPLTILPVVLQFATVAGEVRLHDTLGGAISVTLAVLAHPFASVTVTFKVKLIEPISTDARFWVVAPLLHRKV
jgi:membrane-bound metal-dependent hydrolase YbcI (DUF457 family)